MKTSRTSTIATLDVFSGIGGMSYTLRNIAHPVAYCEIDPVSRDVIRNNIRHGNLHDAPIVPDVHELNAHALSSIVHKRNIRSDRNTYPSLVLAGFPCVGFSSAGKRRGFLHTETALFFELLRVIDDLSRAAFPPLLLLENVPQVLNNGMHIIVTELGKKRQYTLAWTTLSASDLGAPHLRKRWYCFAIPKQRHAIVEDTLHCLQTLQEEHNNAHLITWDHNEPDRVTSARSQRDRQLLQQRIKQLGNAIVPIAMYHATRFLVRAVIDDTEWFLRKKQKVSASFKYPSTGLYKNRICAAQPSNVIEDFSKKDYKLVLLPRAFDHLRQRLVLPHHKKSELIENPMHKSHWSTPTKTDGMSGTSAFLTYRSSKKLKTQVRFEKHTPHSKRHWPMSAEFVEWLMGYPLGWTDCTKRSPNCRPGGVSL